MENNIVDMKHTEIALHRTLSDNSIEHIKTPEAETTSLAGSNDGFDSVSNEGNPFRAIPRLPPQTAPSPLNCGQNTTRILTAAAIGLGGLGVALANSPYCPIAPTWPHLLGLFIGLEATKLPEEMRDGGYVHLGVWSLRQIGCGVAATLGSAALFGLAPQAIPVTAAATLGVLATSLVITRAIGKTNVARLTEFSKSHFAKRAVQIQTVIQGGLWGVYLGVRTMRPAPGAGNGVAAALLAIEIGKKAADIFLNAGTHLTWPAENCVFAKHMEAADIVSQNMGHFFSAASQLMSLKLA